MLMPVYILLSISTTPVQLYSKDISVKSQTKFTVMAKKMSKDELIDSLRLKAGVSSDEAFGALFGVKKQSVTNWRKDESQLPFDRLLSRFGQETLDFIRQEYGLVSESSYRHEEIGRMAEELVKKIMGQ